MSDIDNNSDDVDYYSVCGSDDSFVNVPSLAESLHSQFSDVPKNFNVVHINAQSIPAHFPDMLANFDCKNIHAILVSESWLKPCLPSTLYSLPGFQLIRNDRVSGGGGGVAIYLRSYIPYKNIDMSAQPPPSDAGEHLFLEVELNHTKILLGVYYCPSIRINYFSSFETMLVNLMPSYSHTIIMGDFNTCLLKNDYRTSSFVSITTACNISILPLNATHNFPNSTPSLLDLILVTSLEHVSLHGQYPADMFSYHDLIFVSYKIRPPKTKAKVLLQRNFRGMDLDNLRKDASNIDWVNLQNIQLIDEQVDIFTKNIIKLYDKHAPNRAIKIKHPPSPWLTNEIKSLLSKKAAAKFKYKIKPNEATLRKYVSVRNHCNKVCRDAQRQHIHNNINNKDPSKVWKFLNTLGVGKKRRDMNPKDLDIDSLNQHFSTSSTLDAITKANTIDQLSSIPAPIYSPFVFNHFTACDVKKCVMSITSNAVGNDGISRNMIIPILDIILPAICSIYNHSLSCGAFPSLWKDSLITPIPKTPKPSTFSDYRPISVLPFLSKVLERLIHEQLSSFLHKNQLLNPFQSGFRPGHSTVTTLVHITDEIRSGMENGKLTVLALLDFSNAFNTVDFDVLLSLMQSINISPTVVDWLRSYLCGRRQCIRLESTLSSWCNSTVGVPQGGVLSPLLFVIFINSISNSLRSSYHLYADDFQMYTQATLGQLPQAISTINADFIKINKWTKSYGLKINPAKTQLIVIGSSRMMSKIDWLHLPNVSFDGNIIPILKQIKNLGITMDSCLSWNAQIQEVGRKIFASVGSLRRLRNFLPTATKIALANSLFLPIIDYADVSYLDLAENQLDKLERIQNVCIRFIFGLRKYDHVSQFRKQLSWLPIRLRRNTHILSFLYKVLFYPSTPSYLKGNFKFLHETHDKNLRSSENLKLKMPIHSTTFADNTFMVSAVRLWNALPLNIRQSKSLVAFKASLKRHYLSL